MGLGLAVGHFYAVRGAFLQQWRVTASVRELVLISIFQTPLAVGLGWVARSSDEPAVVATVAIGAGLMILWSMAVFYTGFAMTDELFGGTLELNMLSHSPVAFVMLGKSLAFMTFYAMPAAIGGVGAWLMAGSDASVARPELFALSGLVVLASVVVVQFLFSPLTLLVGGSAGFFNAIMPAGVVLSGYLYPVTTLPFGLEVVARMLPTSWAMEALVWSLAGDHGTGAILLRLLVAVGLSLAFILLERYLFRFAEARAQLQGSLMGGE